MDAAAVKALHSWVMEQGGILVLSRGRCYGGRLDGMEALEPFVWGNNADAAEHRLAPAQEGLSSGLFGSVLPGAEEDVWGSLPALDDVWAVQQPRAGCNRGRQYPDAGHDAPGAGGCRLRQW